MHLSAWLHMSDCLKLSHLYVVFEWLLLCMGIGTGGQDRVVQLRTVLLSCLYTCMLPIRALWTSPRTSWEFVCHCRSLSSQDDVEVWHASSHNRFESDDVRLCTSDVQYVQKGSTPSCYSRNSTLLHLLCGLDAAVEALRTYPLQHAPPSNSHDTLSPCFVCISFQQVSNCWTARFY